MGAIRKEGRVKTFVAAVFMLLSVPVSAYAEHGPTLRAHYDTLSPGDRFTALPAALLAFELVKREELRDITHYTYAHVLSHAFAPQSKENKFSVEFLEIAVRNGAVLRMYYEFCKDASPGPDGLFLHSEEWGFCDVSESKMGDFRPAQ